MRLATMVLGAGLLLGLPTTARADDCIEFGCGADQRFSTLVLFGVPYAGVTLGMGIKDIVADEHSVGYGIAETIVHAPLAIAWGAAAVDSLASSADKGLAPWYLGFTALHTALTAHGVYTVVKDRPARPADAPGGFQVGRVNAAVAPTTLQGGAGLGIAGSF
jgi:hypothetical protein